jgi:hypothetical protein
VNRQEAHEWPPGWGRDRPGDDDLLAHPAVRAALIHAYAASLQPCERIRACAEDGVKQSMAAARHTGVRSSTVQADARSAPS